MQVGNFVIILLEKCLVLSVDVLLFLVVSYHCLDLVCAGEVTLRVLPQMGVVCFILIAFTFRILIRA